MKTDLLARPACLLRLAQRVHVDERLAQHRRQVIIIRVEGVGILRGNYTETPLSVKIDPKSATNATNAIQMQ